MSKMAIFDIFGFFDNPFFNPSLISPRKIMQKSRKCQKMPFFRKFQYFEKFEKVPSKKWTRFLAIFGAKLWLDIAKWPLLGGVSKSHSKSSLNEFSARSRKWRYYSSAQGGIFRVFSKIPKMAQKWIFRPRKGSGGGPPRKFPVQDPQSH